MRLSANRHAEGSMINQPMSSETPKSCQNRKHNPNYRHIEDFARGEESRIHRDIIATVS